MNEFVKKHRVLLLLLCCGTLWPFALQCCRFIFSHPNGKGKRRGDEQRATYNINTSQTNDSCFTNAQPLVDSVNDKIQLKNGVDNIMHTELYLSQICRPRLSVNDCVTCFRLIQTNTQCHTHNEQTKNNKQTESQKTKADKKSLLLGLFIIQNLCKRQKKWCNLWFTATKMAMIRAPFCFFLLDIYIIVTFSLGDQLFSFIFLIQHA